VEWLISSHGKLAGRVAKIVSRELGWSGGKGCLTGAWPAEWLRSHNGSLAGRVVQIVSREVGKPSG